MQRLPLQWVYFAGLALLFVSALTALLLGPVNLPLSETLRLAAPFVPDESVTEQTRIIVEDIRLPRMLISIVIGAILGLCGAAMQGLFRNPLADPSLIGITSGAILGASLVIVLLGVFSLNIAFWQFSLVPVGAFIGGLLVCSLVYGLAYGKSARNSGAPISVATMLLAGIAVTALVASISSMLEYIADSQSLRQLSLWRMGGLDNVSFANIIFALAVLLVSFIFLMRKADALNALLLGESEARYLGVNVESTTRQLILIVAVAMGVAVALSGAIAFIGLVVPHVVRLLVGPDHRSLLPLSALGGALLLCASDTAARVLMAPNEIPVGIITALIGAPFFIYILKSQSAYRW